MLKKVTWYDAPWTSSDVIGSLKYRRVDDSAVLCYLFAAPRQRVKNECVAMLPCGFRSVCVESVSVIEEGDAKSRTAKLAFTKDGYVYFSTEHPGGNYVIKTFFDTEEI